MYINGSSIILCKAKCEHHLLIAVARSVISSDDMQCVAVCCSVLQCAAVCHNVLQCVALCCSVLQCVAVCCSVMQCNAVCCRVLH